MNQKDTIKNIFEVKKSTTAVNENVPDISQKYKDIYRKLHEIGNSIVFFIKAKGDFMPVEVHKFVGEADTAMYKALESMGNQMEAFKIAYGERRMNRPIKKATDNIEENQEPSVESLVEDVIDGLDMISGGDGREWTITGKTLKSKGGWWLNIMDEYDNEYVIDIRVDK